MAGRRNSEPDGDIPVREYLRTRNLDEARAFCRQLFYDSVRVTPLGAGDDLDFVGEGIRLGPLTVGETSTAPRCT